MNRIICLSILLFGFVAGRAQFPVGVQVNVVQPVPPYLPQIKADMLGQRASQLNQDITTHLSIVLRYTGRVAQRVKLAGSIERVAPSLMGVSLRPDFQPAQPILLGPAQPIVSLTKDMLQSAFGNFSENSLVYTNCDLNTLRQNGIDFKLPEGTYRICVTAYDYDKPGFSAPLSTPGTGCAYFTICYTASAPQLILPVSTFVNASAGTFQDLVPHSGQVQFTWTPPSTTCGIPMGPLSYNLEVRRVFPGQTVSDAVNNPYVFQQQFIPATTFLLDTLKYGHLLVPGQQYIVRVKANFVPMIGSPLEVANQGYSEIGAFTWSPVSYFPNIGLVNAPVPAPKPIAPGSIQPGGYINEPYTPTAACAVSVPIANTTAIGSLPGSVTIDGFPMTISSSSVNTDGSYKGSGYIVWRPYGSDVKLTVNFDSLRVNTDKVVYAGAALTASDAGFPDWSVFGASGVDPVAALTGLGDPTLGAIQSRMTGGGYLINGGLGGNPAKFPLGLSTTMGGAPFTLAVMGISFRSSCTNMNVLFDLKVPDLGGSLALAGTGLSIGPNSALTGTGGVLYLPQDKTYSTGVMAFDFNACPSAGSGAVDTSKGSYVAWDAVKGLGNVVINADITFPGNRSIVAVDASDKRLTSPASIHARFAFSDWNDWVATATLSNDFELAGLPGFPIHSDGLFYDHSTKQNPVAIGFPAGYVGAQDASFEGLYIPSLAMSLPGSFQSFSGAKTGAIKFQNFILDNSGVTTTIGATNVLDISTGSLGGWAFSIDKISIAVVQDNFQNGMAMTGQIKLPIASDGLGYTCSLNSVDGQVNYQFVVKPSGDITVPLWLASVGLDANSSFVIQSDAAGMEVKTHLNGSIGITIGKAPAVTLPALSFQDMAMANRADTAAGSGAGFFFSAGKWSLGGGVPIPAGFTGLTGLEGAVAGGPNVSGDAESAGDAAFDDASSQGTIAGFSLALSDFSPKILPKGKLAVEAGVYFNIKVGIGFGDATVVSGAARLGILGEIDIPGTSAPSASFDGIDCDSISIDGAVGPVTVSGKLGFRNGDKTYGDGIYGSLSADLVFAKFDAAAQFGTAPAGFHYWAVGGSIYLPGGIVVGPGLTVNGFGGGVFYNMQLTTPGPNDPQLHSTTPGQIPMVPVSGTFGIQAELLVAAIQPDVCNGSLLLTGTIVNGGLGQLRLDGQGDIVTNAPENTTSLVSAGMTMVYDFVKKSYDLQVQVTVSFLIGNATGELWVHGGPDGEYVYVGEPDNRVTLNLLDINLSLLKVKLGANAYFDVGTELPAFPALPAEVASKQGDKSANDAAVGSFLQQISRPDPKTGLSPNAGIMFGAQVSGSIDLNLLFLYASVDATIGFDVALLHVTNPPPGCVQNGTFGYNNWYGMGQFYAAFHLDVGLHVDAWFYHGDVDLVTFDAICVLQAGLPNPTWVDGEVTVSGSALGGLVNVSGQFPFSFGDKCVIQEDPLDGIQMITDIGPTDSASVFADPTAAYSVPMDNTDYPIQMPSDDNHPTPYTRTFRFSVVQFNLSKVMKDGSDSLAAGLNQGSGFDMSGDGLGSTLYPKTMLEPHTKYSMYIQCQVKELTDAGLVTPAESNGGLQDTTYTFTTGSAPSTIPPANVAYSYPTDGQRYFLKNEFGQRGTIKIGSWQYDILPSSSGALLAAGGGYDYLVYFISSKGDTVTTPFTLNQPLSSLDFQIPATLRNSEVYDMQVWVKPRTPFAAKTLAPNITQKLVSKSTSVTQQSTTMSASGGYTPTASRQLVSTVAIKKNYITMGAQSHPLGSIPIFTLRFETSQYNSFQQKISAYGQWTSQAENGNKDIILTAAAAPESFDEFEIKGTTNVCTTCDLNTIPKSYPPMFNAAIPWNNAVQNDKYASDNLYANAFEMEFFNVTMNLGAMQVRDLLIPDNCVSTSLMPYQPKLATLFQSLGSVSKESLVGGSGVGLALASGKSSSGNAGGLGVSFVARGATIGLPMSYLSKGSSSAGAASGSAGGQVEMEMRPTLSGSTTVATTASSPRLMWMHDDYIYADYSLLHQFGVSFIADQSNVVSMPIMGDVPLAVLNAMNGEDVVFATGEYGSISMDAAHYLTRYNDPALTRVANSLSGVGFQPLPPSSHTLQLKYMYPFCGPCGVGSVVPQTVNYELITRPVFQKMTIQR